MGGMVIRACWLSNYMDDAARRPSEYMINATERSTNDVSPSGKLNLRPCGLFEHKFLIAGKVI